MTHKQEPPELRRRGDGQRARLKLAWLEQGLDGSDSEAVLAFAKQHDARFKEDYREAWDALYRQWYGRCAYCTAEVSTSKEIDHFRPCRALDAKRGAHDGYWWLAWTWLNLLPACGACNKAKGNEFPVRGRRLQPWEEDTAREHARLINPSCEDPLDDIEFARELLYDGSERWTLQGKTSGGRGAVTVELLGLDRDTERYATHLERLRELVTDLEAARERGPTALREFWARKMEHQFGVDPSGHRQPFPLLSRAYLSRHFGEAIKAHGLSFPPLGDPPPAPRAAPSSTPPRGLDEQLQLRLTALRGNLRPPSVETRALLVALARVRAWSVDELVELFPQQRPALLRHLRALAKRGELELEDEQVRIKRALTRKSRPK